MGLGSFLFGVVIYAGYKTLRAIGANEIEKEIAIAQEEYDKLNKK